MVEIRETEPSHENGIRGEKSLSKTRREKGTYTPFDISEGCLFVLLAGLERAHEDDDDDDDFDGLFVRHVIK